MKTTAYEDFIGMERHRHDFIQPLLRSIAKSPILDVGCGDGCLMVELRNKGHDIEGFDISLIAVNLARDKKLNVRCSSIKDYTPKRKYKTIILVSVLPWVVDPIEDFRKVCSWLADDGIIITTVGNNWSIKKLLGLTKEYNPKKFNPNYFKFKRIVESNGLKIKKVIALGKGKIFPLLATIPIYILSRENKK